MESRQDGNPRGLELALYADKRSKTDEADTEPTGQLSAAAAERGHHCAPFPAEKRDKQTRAVSRQELCHMGREPAAQEQRLHGANDHPT